jgi:uncharacterized membrane protein (DUF106 family)
MTSGMIEVMLFTIGMSLVLAIIYRLLTKPEEMRRIKENMKEIQAKVKHAQKSGDTDQVSALTSEMLKGSQQQFTQNMKPMIVSMVIFFVFIGFLRATYQGTLIQMPFAVPFIGSVIGWFKWYILITLPFTLFFRKLLGVE